MLQVSVQEVERGAQVAQRRRRRVAVRTERVQRGVGEARQAGGAPVHSATWRQAAVQHAEQRVKAGARRVVDA